MITEENKKLKCADKHIFFTENYDEIYAENLVEGMYILTKNGKSKVKSIKSLGYKESMFDFELPENSKHRYYTNDILSHNTHLVKSLAKYLFGSEDSMIRIDMSEYIEKFSISRLIGAPPGYVGYESGGELTEKVRRRPYSVLLFDEIEKAHPDVFHTLLQVLDDGILTDGLGRKVDFKNTIIIMTSNIGSRQLSDFGQGIGFGTSSKKNGVADYEKTVIENAMKKVFAPEFLNRVDDTIMFRSLDKEDIIKIVDLELIKLFNRIKSLGYGVEISDSAREFLAEKGFDTQYGARPLKRSIQKYIEDSLAEQIVGSKVKTGDILSVAVNEENKEEIIVTIKKNET